MRNLFKKRKTLQANHGFRVARRPFAGSRGFTLIETLVAISILLMSIAGPLTIASRGLVASRYSRDQIVAFYLAQEATELIRNKRDNNSKDSNKPWLDGLGLCFSNLDCIIDAQDTIKGCLVGGCKPLNIHKTTGFYSYSSGSNYKTSNFTRTIHLKKINPDEVEISVDIGWKTGTISNNFVINENLLDWQ